MTVVEEPLELTWHDAAERDEIVLRVRGVLDHETAGFFTDETSRHLTVRHVRSLHLELDEVAFCDSSGLSALLVLDRLMREKGASLHWAPLPHALQRMIDITGLGTHFGLHGSSDDVGALS